MAETKFETIQELREALPGLPDDAMIVDSEGVRVHLRDVRLLAGTFAPYTVTYEAPAPLDPALVKAGDTVMSRDVLDALPVGSVVLEGTSGAVIPGVLPTMPGVFHRFPDGWYVVAGQGARDDIDFPVTVLHVPAHQEHTP